MLPQSFVLKISQSSIIFVCFSQSFVFIFMPFPPFTDNTSPFADFPFTSMGIRYIFAS